MACLKRERDIPWGMHAGTKKILNLIIWKNDMRTRVNTGQWRMQSAITGGLTLPILFPIFSQNPKKSMEAVPSHLVTRDLVIRMTYYFPLSLLLVY